MFSHLLSHSSQQVPCESIQFFQPLHVNRRAGGLCAVSSDFFEITCAFTLECKNNF